PTNREADNPIIAEARDPICCDHTSKPTKPPAYLFRYPSMSKSQDNKSNQSANPLATQPTSTISRTNRVTAAAPPQQPAPLR
ncbi:hypothetical protein, partial [Paenirhodobacter populi]|uniref:hypothetical protein n=1 Tax=Paenirhodobacter populi TaxID=2306993 RepID=UPI0019D46642